MWSYGEVTSNQQYARVLIPTLDPKDRYHSLRDESYDDEEEDEDRDIEEEE